MMRGKRLAMALTLVVSGMSCRESAKINGKGREMNQVNQPATTLAELAREAGLKFPGTARLIGSARENGMDDLLRFKVGACGRVRRFFPDSAR